MRKLLFISVASMLISMENQATSQCLYNNVLYETISAPTVVGGTITTLLYGGEFSRITGLVAGNTYQITTCGDNAFDSQITIYKTGGTSLEAFNDDYITCAPQSRIYFSPFTSGNYDVLVDEYNCADNFVNYISVQITLWETPVPIITIPVVVHVVYANSTQNISNAQIQSQIDVLNDDFRRLNSDVSSLPERFKGFSKDCRIQFCLATQDPSGNPSTGITRTATSSAPFSSVDDEMKFTVTGGRDIWDRDYYLNIWVCELSGSTLGYAQFPSSGLASTDGVVIDYTNFGTIGTAVFPFNGGRTATHEVGHWLDLKHIWGDDGALCSGTDLVNDTPNSAGANYNCPALTSTCSNGGFGGDMYVNYMDYTDDDCMAMFSYGQCQRIEATLNGFRSGLKFSNGCQPSEVGVPEYTNINTSVFPNPANDLINVYIDYPVTDLENTEFVIYNMLGSIVTTISEIPSNHFDINTSNFSSGMYFYRIQNNDIILSEGKFTIN